MAFPAFTPATQGPSLSLGPEGSALSGPPLPDTTQAMAVGLHGTEFLSALAQDTCVVHTQAVMTSKACPSQPHSPVPALGIPSPEALLLLPSCTEAVEIWSLGSLPVLTSLPYQRRLL